MGRGKQMAQETEIKLRILNVTAFRQALRRLGGRSVSGGTGRVHEWNVLFDTPEGELAKRGELLRIRTETQRRSASKRAKPTGKRALLTFKCPARAEKAPKSVPWKPERHKVREEIELEIADAAALAKIFDGLGMRGEFRYEKFRTTFRLAGQQRWAKGLLIELDETPIGTFVELEGPPQAIDRAARELGFAERDYIVTNYLRLYQEDCRRKGEKPGDMVFRKGK
jgi:adenylate cyclase class 2